MFAKLSSTGDISPALARENRRRGRQLFSITQKSLLRRQAGLPASGQQAVQLGDGVFVFRILDDVDELAWIGLTVEEDGVVRRAFLPIQIPFGADGAVLRVAMHRDGAPLPETAGLFQERLHADCLDALRLGYAAQV